MFGRLVYGVGNGLCLVQQRSDQALNRPDGEFSDLLIYLTFVNVGDRVDGQIQIFGKVEVYLSLPDMRRERMSHGLP